jgi:hypothetical protein
VAAAPARSGGQPVAAALLPPADEEIAMPHRPFHLNPVRLAGAGLWLAVAAVAAHAAVSGTAKETARTADAVLAVDQHWSDAETDGDTAWLEQMLLPEYRSVNSRGVATPKAAIVAHAARNRGLDEARQKQMVEAWRKTHPSESKVVLRGDTAIITFYDPAQGPLLGVRSVDVFVYEGGRWHALYSQHSGFAGG